MLSLRSIPAAEFLSNVDEHMEQTKTNHEQALAKQQVMKELHMLFEEIAGQGIEREMARPFSATRTPDTSRYHVSVWEHAELTHMAQKWHLHTACHIHRCGPSFLTLSLPLPLPLFLSAIVFVAGPVFQVQVYRDAAGFK
jgi:hypothetical protein